MYEGLTENRIRNVNTGLEFKYEKCQVDARDEDLKTVYLLGMADRGERVKNINPGPGGYDIEPTVF